MMWFSLMKGFEIIHTGRRFDKFAMLDFEFSGSLLLFSMCM